MCLFLQNTLHYTTMKRKNQIVILVGSKKRASDENPDKTDSRRKSMNCIMILNILSYWTLRNQSESLILRFRLHVTSEANVINTNWVQENLWMSNSFPNRRQIWEYVAASSFPHSTCTWADARIWKARHLYEGTFNGLWAEWEGIRIAEVRTFCLSTVQTTNQTSRLLSNPVLAL